MVLQLFHQAAGGDDFDPAVQLQRFAGIGPLFDRLEGAAALHAEDLGFHALVGQVVGHRLRPLQGELHPLLRAGLFGQVVEGMSIVHQIARGDVMKRVTIEWGRP